MVRSLLHNGLFLLLLILGTVGLSAQPAYFNQLDLLQGKKKAVIPFRYVHNFIIIDARIFGIMPAQFIFDTGAEHIILFKRQYTDILQIPYDKRIPIMGSDLSRQVYALIARNGLIEIQGLPARPSDMLILEEDYFDLDEMIGIPVAGLIGGGFFKNLIIQIDYKRNCIVLMDPGEFEPPADHVSLPITIKTNKPYVNAEAQLLDGTFVQVDLLLDTGAGVPLLLHNNSHPSLHLPEEYIRGKLGMGLGGYLEGYIGRIGKLSFGEIDFQSILTSFQDIDEKWLMDQSRFRNGILGNQVLSRFSIYLDYVRGQLYLKPLRKRQEPFFMDRSGLVILAYGLEFNEFVVQDVLENSPAQEAGILPGDIVLKIQGIPGHYFTLNGITGFLQKKPGKKIRMVLKRGDEVIRKEFVLRDLI
jgi:hypothetical protein